LQKQNDTSSDLCILYVLPILQRPCLFLACAGLGLTLAGPASAAESSSSWTLNTAPRANPSSLAMLPQLPAAPRVFAITPERRALLNTIRYAEGTWANGHDIGYRILFGGTLFDSLDRHPNRVVRTARYASAAAGAYQFMPFTWTMITQALGISDFQPEAQDQAALFLVQRRGALHLADRGDLTPDLAARLAPEWASFPTIAGSSFYGQPVKRFHDLKRFYEENLAQLRNEASSRWEDVAIRQDPPACSDASLSCQLDKVGNAPPTTP
jgi:muramidase (phage lysozyme)